MKYTVDWREDGPGVVVITPGGIGAVRLVGLLFGAPGAWLLYQFLDGAMHPGELTIFGWTLLPFMAAVFLGPAWMILVGRKRTRIDAARRQAIEEFDFLIYTRRKTTAIPSEARVTLRYEEGAKQTAKGPVLDNDVTNLVTHVYLTRAPARPRGVPRVRP